MTYPYFIRKSVPQLLAQTSKSQIGIVFCLSLALLFSVPSTASEVLILEPNQRLEASICADSMNRIAVANDRITQIFGDEGTFESQNDENTGQVFLKPTAENGPKSLSITLITEQGITQDLTLTPTAKSATTLILKSKVLGPSQKASERISQSPSEVNSSGMGAFPSRPSEQGLTLQDHLLVLLKQAVAKQLPLQERGFFDDNNISRSNPEGIKLIPHQYYAVPPLGVHVFEVENTSPTSLEMQEKSFYQAGDLAISLEKRVLAPESNTLLYVVTWEDTRVEGHTHD